MVAGAGDHCFDPYGVIDCAGRQFGPCTFYLYVVLSIVMDRSKQSETLVALMLGLIVLYWFKRWNGLLVAAVVTGVTGLLVPAVGQAIHWGWSRLSLLLGEVSGKVLLTVVYFFILAPISWLARRRGKLHLKMRAGGDSYFTERNHTYDKKDLLHPW